VPQTERVTVMPQQVLPLDQLSDEEFARLEQIYRKRLPDLDAPG
jgi:hypothetical protein